MRYLPLFRNVDGRACLVVGGGPVAQRKIQMLLRAKAAVTVVAPEATEEIRGWNETGRVVWTERRFHPKDIAGRVLVFSATGNATVDKAVSSAARAAGVPVGVVDAPDLSDFITPAIVDRSPLVVAISSGGAAPVLARQIRATVEALLPASLGQLATAADRLRAQVRDRIPAIDARRRFWTGFFRNWRSDSLLARKGAPSAIDAAAIDRFLTAPAQAGRVAIVGAGPGDPDLLTLKALQFLQDADVIVHDRLVGPGVLDYARRDAETIYVGKAPGKHSHSQDEINVLLAHHAGLGKQVVRLKGGDPFIFGRGGEERAYLAERGIEVTIVPGITAAAGCAAAAGIPLTHRGTAQSVTYLTGAAAGDFPDYDWPALARTGGTLVIYMGVGTAKIIATRLIENGLAAATPVAVIENGTLPTQRTVTGTLGGLGALVRREGIQSPALLLIGEVVAQADITAGNRLVTAGHGCVMTYNDKEGSIMQGKVLTANILIDGIVVYLAAGDAWTAKLPEARFLTDESEQKRLMHIAEQDVERRIIVDPYLMDAEGGADGPEPVSQRERIRATGPTIPTHFNTSPSES